MRTFPDAQTDCRCASCRGGIAEYADPQISRSVRRTPEPEFCAGCYARILEGRASGVALELHGLLAEIDATGVELSAHSHAMLKAIDAWLDLSGDSDAEAGNIVTGRF